LNLPFFIARRYLFSKRKKNFINIISILSMVGVAFITAALIIVLSVFNGLGGLLRSLNNSFDPEIKIQATGKKSFELTEDLLKKVKSVKGVEIVTEVIEDHAYVTYRESNQVVRLKGVSDNFIEQHRIPEENIVEGKLALRSGDVNYAIIGRGVQYTLSVAIGENLFPLQVIYPKKEKAAGLDPTKLLNRKSIMPGGVFSIVQNFDENFILVPLEFASDLMGYENKRTSLEIKTDGTTNLDRVESELQKALGESFLVLNPEEQHEDLYRLLKIEKLFAFFALTLLLIIGSINIFFSLMMLAIDKKKDITILSSMGATPSLIRNIFLTEGALIAALGAVSGLALGGVLCWIQMEFGLISMGMESAVSPGYPVDVNLVDFVATLFVVSIVTFLISIRPANLAARLVGDNKELLLKQ
jgi:lipoprotein-releasing system permease protein